MSAGTTNLSFVAVDQYGVITAIQEQLQRRGHILRRYGHERVLVGGNRDLEVLDAVLLDEFLVFCRVFLGDKSPSSH